VGAPGYRCCERTAPRYRRNKPVAVAWLDSATVPGQPFQVFPISTSSPKLAGVLQTFPGFAGNCPSCQGIEVNSRPSTLPYPPSLLYEHSIGSLVTRPLSSTVKTRDAFSAVPGLMSPTGWPVKVAWATAVSAAPRDEAFVARMSTRRDLPPRRRHADRSRRGRPVRLAPTNNAWYRLPCRPLASSRARLPGRCCPTAIFHQPARHRV
jgi:hypothetical protein